MGWRYGLFYLEEKVDLEEFRKKVMENTKIDDFTYVNKESIIFDKEKEKMFAEAIELKDRELTEKILNMKHPDPEVLAFEKLCNDPNAFRIYLLRFYKFKDKHIVFYTTPRFDIKHQFFSVALFLLYKIGYRGNLMYISGNSVVDQVGIVKLNMVDDEDKRIEKIYEIESEMGEYEEFLKSRPEPLWELHQYLLRDDRELELSIGFKESEKING